MLTDVDWKNARLPMSLIACSLPGQPKWARAFSWPFRASRVSLSLSLSVPLLASRGVSLLLASRAPSWPHLASLGLSRPHMASPGIAWPPLPAASSPSLTLRRLSRPPWFLPGSRPRLASRGLTWLFLTPPGFYWPLLACPGLSSASPNRSSLLLAPSGFSWPSLAFPGPIWLLVASPGSARPCHLSNQ